MWRINVGFSWVFHDSLLMIMQKIKRSEFGKNRGQLEGQLRYSTKVKHCLCLY